MNVTLPERNACAARTPRQALYLSHRRRRRERRRRLRLSVEAPRVGAGVARHRAIQIRGRLERGDDLRKSHRG